MSNTQQMKRIARFALFGAAGFGIGGLTEFLIIEREHIVFSMLPAIPISGALGGAALGLAFWDWRRVIPLALLGAIGFGVGSFAGGLINVLVVESDVVMLGTLGAIAGAVLGLPHRGLVLTSGGWRKIIGLALAGALGFGIGAMIANLINEINDLWFVNNPGLMALVGVIGGAFLGATLGFLEKEK